MNKKFKKQFVEKRLSQKRYLIKFSKNIDFELLNQNPNLRKQLEWISFKNSSGQAYVDQHLHKSQLIRQLAATLSLDLTEVSVQEMGEGLSNLYPL